MNADKGSPDALVVEPRTMPGQDRPGQDVSPERPPRRDALKLVGVLAAVVVASLVALGVWALSRPAATPETVVPAQETHHDSGITQALREHNRALEAQHDSGITQAVRERDGALEAHHDSGIAQALRERDRTLEAHHDSGIAQALREREQAGQSPTAP